MIHNGEEVYNVMDTTRLTGLSHTDYYDLVKSGDLPKPELLIGKRHYYSKKEFANLRKALEAYKRKKLEAYKQSLGL